MAKWRRKRENRGGMARLNNLAKTDSGENRQRQRNARWRRS